MSASYNCADDTDIRRGPLSISTGGTIKQTHCKLSISTGCTIKQTHCKLSVSNSYHS